MRLRLAAHGVELSGGLKEYVERRVHFALGRFAGRIRSLSIRLADVNGPRGGVDKSCEIRVNLGHRKELMVRDRHASIHSAIASAAERVERAVRRQLKASIGGPDWETAGTPGPGAGEAKTASRDLVRE